MYCGHRSLITRWDQTGVVWNFGSAVQGRDLMHPSDSWREHWVWVSHVTQLLDGPFQWKQHFHENPQSHRDIRRYHRQRDTEIHRLRRHIKLYEKSTGKETVNWKANGILINIVKWGFEESFPEIPIIQRTFLTTCVSIAACERSFSKLKLIKTYVRSTTSHSRLSNLAILSIERELAESIDFKAVTDGFGSQVLRIFSWRIGRGKPHSHNNNCTLSRPMTL